MPTTFNFNSKTNSEFKKLTSSAVVDDMGNTVTQPESQFDVLAFPEDLFSPKTYNGLDDKVNFAMGFYIFVPISARAVFENGSQVFNESETGQISSTRGLQYASEVNKPLNVDQIVGTAKKLAEGKERLRIQRQNRILKKMIMLYMPETLNSDLQINYSNMDFGGTTTALAGSIVDIVANGMTGNMEGIKKNAADVAAAIGFKGGKFVQAGLGSAINPMSEVLFENMQFRSFTFDYKFTPKSVQEARDVDSIVRLFRTYAVPEFNQNSAAGAFFSVPAFFQLKFFKISNGSLVENDKINKISGCALENVLVDYAPDGYAMHKDGYPVSTRIQMTFKELEVMHRDRIQDGY
jgi:hypothetical protein